MIPAEHGTLTAEYVARLLEEAREELGRADAKASTIFAAAGVTIAVVIGAAADTGVDLGKLPTLAQVMMVLALVVQGIGLASLGWAILPRTAQGREGRLHYFADVWANPEKRLRSLADREATDPAERDLQQLVAISEVLRKKYAGVSRGLIWTGWAALLFLAASGVGLVA